MATASDGLGVVREEQSVKELVDGREDFSAQMSVEKAGKNPASEGVGNVEAQGNGKEINHSASDHPTSPEAAGRIQGQGGEDSPSGNTLEDAGAAVSASSHAITHEQKQSPGVAIESEPPPLAHPPAEHLPTQGATAVVDPAVLYAQGAGVNLHPYLQLVQVRVFVC